MNTLRSLNQHGQSVWLDNISRGLITSGGLQRLIDEDGVSGVTSNPTIFDKALAGGTAYDAALHRALETDRNLNNRALAERLIVGDIQLAADVLRPVYDGSDGEKRVRQPRSLARVRPRHREIFGGEPFASLRRRGARVQRPLWASTGTKNPLYSDVLYLEALIGPVTITTVPPATMDAFRDHGRVRVTLGTREEEAEAVLASATALGLDVRAITEQLQAEAITAFATSFDHLLATVDEKRRGMLATAR